MKDNVKKIYVLGEPLEGSRTFTMKRMLLPGDFVKTLLFISHPADLDEYMDADQAQLPVVLYIDRFGSAVKTTPAGVQPITSSVSSSSSISSPVRIPSSSSSSNSNSSSLSSSSSSSLSLWSSSSLSSSTLPASFASPFSSSSLGNQDLWRKNDKNSLLRIFSLTALAASEVDTRQFPTHEFIPFAFLSLVSALENAQCMHFIHH